MSSHTFQIIKALMLLRVACSRSNPPPRQQESARMEFVLTKETQEANRKQIEAQGIASFQKIVSEGISDQLLSWKGIEATERLAESPNSKIIMVGNTKDSLPVLLSSSDQS